ncbi:hypothetical protein [Paracidovorax sp. MALMAid1276]|uniref:hypothetical protein n=1 Tax=Paracidovorax sp. MALMAid1276 TaxID=3411631 RepID=UPI003B9B0848
MTTFTRLIGNRSCLIFAAALTLGGVLLAPVPSAAQTLSDEASLQRGAQPDTTGQQRYQSAIREAGGGLKVSLAECAAMGAAERRSCEPQARSRYQRDMAAAKVYLKDPTARPINVVGEPIRTTETVIVVK